MSLEFVYVSLDVHLFFQSGLWLCKILFGTKQWGANIFSTRVKITGWPVILKQSVENDFAYHSPTQSQEHWLSISDDWDNLLFWNIFTVI